jgi:hypothetical protein
MCHGCWGEYEDASIINDRVLAAVPLIGYVYDYHGAGGTLHIVLDDWNIEDDHLDFCDGEIAKGGIDPDRLDAERECSAALRILSVQERASALAIHSGYFKP